MFKINNSVNSLLRHLSVLQLHARCSSTEKRQSRMLQKLMTGKRKIVHKWGEHAIQKPEALHMVKKTPTKLSTRRTTVLNKMFMRHVTDLIASGPIGYELNGLGLEITQVKVCQNYHGLNIFWTATGTDDFDHVEQKLLSISRKLRHELHQMQLMGNCPHLTFVRDEKLSYFDALESVIEKADYGDDFKPLMTRLREADFELQENKPEQQDSADSTVVPMRHDVFGLDHALIMGRVKQSMAKSKQAWKSYEEKQSNPSNTKPFTFSTSFESIREEHVSAKHSEEMLQEFLQKRKLLRKLKRAEEAEFNSKALDEEKFHERQNSNDDFDEPIIEDPIEVEKFYDELESFEK